MFIFESYSLDAVEAQKLFWLFINVLSFKKSSKRFLFANWFMLFFRSWQSVADSLRRRSFDNLLAFRFVLFSVQITMSLRIGTSGEIIAIEAFFVFIAWYMSDLYFFFLHLFSEALRIKRFVSFLAKPASSFWCFFLIKTFRELMFLRAVCAALFILAHICSVIVFLTFCALLYFAVFL